MRQSTPRTTSTKRFFLLTAVLAGALAGAGVVPAAAGDALVVYSGRGESLVGSIFERFEKATGIKTDVRYNDTPALATQLLAEAEVSPADVILFQESGYLGALADSGLLETLPGKLLARTDARFNDPKGKWIGTSGRARVLVYNKDAVTSAGLPVGLAGLANERWRGKLGWAPGNASFQAHVSVLRHVWGNAATRNWLAQMKDLKPRVYPKNSPQVEAANNGEISIGWVNHYYLHRMMKPGFRAANYSFAAQGDVGNVLMVSAAAVRKGSSRKKDALRLLEYLTGPEAQAFFAQEGYEYPTRPGIKTHENVAPLDELNLAIVDQRHLADLAPTLAMLRELGLL